MEKKLKAWEIGGLLFFVLAGTLLHFVFDWSNGHPAAAVVSPVGESIWEHLKMFFMPTLFYSLFEYLFLGKRFRNFFAAKTAGILAGMIAIVVIFYTYSGMIGTHILWVDILLFLCAIAGSYAISYSLLCTDLFSGKGFQILSLAVLLTLTVLFAVFTFYPPDIPLFQDPNSGSVGSLFP